MSHILNLIVEFEIGDVVYLKTGEHDMGIVTSYIVYPENRVIYSVSIGMATESFYAIELSKEKVIV